MTCKEVIRRLSDYIDAELDPEAVEQLERHLEHCEDCRMVVDTTRKTIRLFCGVEPLPLPAGLQYCIEHALVSRLNSGPASPSERR